jgi:pyruvate ferredoxin oxidoreductase alpha subunit/phenylglyoxylate dehydrogenase alpha subunit
MSPKKVMDGNMAAAYGAILSKPTVLAAYPITPQTPLVEYLSNFIADGQLDAEMVQVESEHSALSVLQGACLAGGRVFTGTSSQGLALMYEPYIRTSTLRLPMVMAIANREVISPQSVWGGQQDAVTLRDAGWIQIFCENNQEILDSVIMGYRIAEDKDVLLPLNVCYDGFYLSHMSEGVDIPSQKRVDQFLPPFEIEHIKLDPKEPMSVDPLTPGDLLTEYRFRHVVAMEKAKAVIDRVDQEFQSLFKRGYGGQVEAYCAEDADLLLVTMGSPSGTAKVAVDMARAQGIGVGLLKIRALRPFPSERVVDVANDKKMIAVIDRNVCFGWGSGVVFMELKASLGSLSKGKGLLNYIGGLGGSDITVDHVLSIIQKMDIEKGKRESKVIWLGIDDV